MDPPFAHKARRVAQARQFYKNNVDCASQVMFRNMEQIDLEAKAKYANAIHAFAHAANVFESMDQLRATFYAIFQHRRNQYQACTDKFYQDIMQPFDQCIRRLEPLTDEEVALIDDTRRGIHEGAEQVKSHCMKLVDQRNSHLLLAFEEIDAELRAAVGSMGLISDEDCKRKIQRLQFKL